MGVGDPRGGWGRGVPRGLVSGWCAYAVVWVSGFEAWGVLLLGGFGWCWASWGWRVGEWKSSTSSASFD